MQRRCFPAFAFCWKRMRLSVFESEGTGGGVSPKAEEGRREMVHLKPWYLRLL